METKTPKKRMGEKKNVNYVVGKRGVIVTCPRNEPSLLSWNQRGRHVLIYSPIRRIRLSAFTSYFLREDKGGNTNLAWVAILASPPQHREVSPLLVGSCGRQKWLAHTPTLNQPNSVNRMQNANIWNYIIYFAIYYSYIECIFHIIAFCFFDYWGMVLL